MKINDKRQERNVCFGCISSTSVDIARPWLSFSRLFTVLGNQNFRHIVQSLYMIPLEHICLWILYIVISNFQGQLWKKKIPFIFETRFFFFFPQVRRTSWVMYWNRMKPFKEAFQTTVHLMLGFFYRSYNQIVHSVIKSSSEPRGQGCQVATLKTLCFYLHLRRLLDLHIYLVSQSSGLLRAKIFLLSKWRNLWVTAFTFATAVD